MTRSQIKAKLQFISRALTLLDPVKDRDAIRAYLAEFNELLDRLDKD